MKLCEIMQARELLGPVADHGGLLCFDELQANDPFNAIAVREIFQRLLELGVVVVTTSNRDLASLNRWTSRLLTLPLLYPTLHLAGA